MTFSKDDYIYVLGPEDKLKDPNGKEAGVASVLVLTLSLRSHRMVCVRVLCDPVPALCMLVILFPSSEEHLS